MSSSAGIPDAAKGAREGLPVLPRDENCRQVGDHGERKEELRKPPGWVPGFEVIVVHRPFHVGEHPEKGGHGAEHDDLVVTRKVHAARENDESNGAKNIVRRLPVVEPAPILSFD